MTPPLLTVEALAVDFVRGNAATRVVDGVDLAVAAGEIVGLVGESGCGKSTVAMALPRLLPANGRIVGGRVVWRGRDLATVPSAELRSLRGRGLAWLPQEPGAAFDPAFTVGSQLVELLRLHRGIDARAARTVAAKLLQELGVADPAARLLAQPHQLSGGLRQRVALALALAGEPALLIADEPTSALDVAVALQVLTLLETERRTRGLAILLISHDLPLLAARCDRLLVMYAGRIVESGPARALLAAPRHPYTRALLAARPPLRPLTAGERLDAIPGQGPLPGAWPAGCRFEPRCQRAVAACVTPPPLVAIGAERWLACPVTAKEPA